MLSNSMMSVILILCSVLYSPEAFYSAGGNWLLFEVLQAVSVVQWNSNQELFCSIQKRKPYGKMARQTRFNGNKIVREQIPWQLGTAVRPLHADNSWGFQLGS